MKTNHLLSAIGHVDDQYKQEVLDQMNKQKTGHYQAHPVRRTLRLIPAAAAMICLLAVTAYAAVNYWGIFDFRKDALDPLPTEAQKLVQTQDEVGSNDYVTCSIKESLTDGQKLHLVVQVQAKESGKYILLCNMIDPSCQVREIGVDADGTIEEYAKANNLQCIYVGASIKQTAKGGPGVGNAMEKYHAPDVVDILLERSIADMGSTTEGICVVTAHDENAKNVDDISRKEIPFTFTNESTSGENVYHPTSQPNVEGMTVGNITVTQTDLGTYFDIDMEQSEYLMTKTMVTLRIRHDTGYSSAYGFQGENGEHQWCIEAPKMEIGDSFILEVWDPGDDSYTGEIEFTK